jgi:hypothetical protein
VSPTEDDWREHRQYIVRKLDEQSAEISALHEQVTLMRIDLAMLKVRAGLWGALAGAVPAGLAILAVLTGVGG